jgi:hypothetical protein
MTFWIVSLLAAYILYATISSVPAGKSRRNVAILIIGALICLMCMHPFSQMMLVWGIGGFFH